MLVQNQDTDSAELKNKLLTRLKRIRHIGGTF